MLHNSRLLRCRNFWNIIVEVLKYYSRRNIYFYWQHLLEPLEAYVLLIYAGIDRCYVLFCVLFKIIQVSVCETPPTVFIQFLNTCYVFHNHLPSPLCNLDIDNSGGQVPAHGESLPSSFPGIVRIYFCTSVFILFVLLKYVHMYGLLLVWSLHPFNDLLYLALLIVVPLDSYVVSRTTDHDYCSLWCWTLGKDALILEMKGYFIETNAGGRKGTYSWNE